jgi:acyl-CoA hydrolase
MTELVLPNGTNRLGNLLGGRLMLDRHRGRHRRVPSHQPGLRHRVGRRTVLLNPVKQGEVVVLRSVNRVFRTSLEVGVNVTTENTLTGDRKHTNTAYLTFGSH